MKWFKHMSDLPRDEGVSRYLDAAGKDRVTAYGFLMFVLEAIAARMDANTGHLVCSATYSISHWGRITYSHPNRVRKYLRLCRVTGWVQVAFEEGSCKVSVPRMVEWRDDYTRKSGVRPEKVAQSREEEIREDKRESEEHDSLSYSLAQIDVRRSPPPDFEVTPDLMLWATSQRPDVDIGRETEKFMLNDFTTPRSDWISEWKKWILNAHPSRLVQQRRESQANRKEQLIDMARLLEMHQESEESESDFLSRVEQANEKRIAAMQTLGTLQ